MDKGPDRAFINLEVAFRQFTGEFAQSEVAGFDTLKKPLLVRSGDQKRSMPTHLTRREVPGLPLAPGPTDYRRLAEIKIPGHRSATRARLDPPNHSLPKVH